MALLLPFVVVPFRYPSTLLPPHHYSVPLATPTLDAAPITVPTFHGAYPVYSYPPVPPSHTPTSRPSATSRPPQAGVPRAPQARPDIQSPLPTSTSISRRAPPAQIGRALHARLLTAPPARLLFFARMQAAARMGVPPHLARDRAAADARFVGNGGTGPPPIGPTQADIYEKNARPVVRFERQLPSAPSTQSSSGAAFPSTATATSSASSTSTSVPTSISAPTRNDPLAILPILDSDSDSDSDTGESRSSGVKRKRKRDTRWAPDAWRARLCVGYGGVWGDAASVVTAPSPSASSSRVLLPGAASTSAAASAARTPAAGTGTSASAGASGVSRGTGQAHVPRGGAPPGRIGRVYELGSMAGLWAGTMLMPSEPPYNALLATPGGAFPASGLARDDFVAAARPVYMRIEEHWS
ncbi:hypothetical protein C8R43DRAFT_1013880 [Mycena crocata]|nr:hypothetical protein C8R43DRAFT_1013880 [Mycena crocata]